MGLYGSIPTDTLLIHLNFILWWVKLMAKKEEFQFKEYITNLDLNKYVKEGFIRSLEKEPKTLKETEKLLKKYLGE